MGMLLGECTYLMKVAFAERHLEFQAPLVVTTAAPVSTTWYTVLNITDAGLLITASAGVDTADETIELEITIDGHLIPLNALPATADTDYHAVIFWDNSQDRFELHLSGLDAGHRYLYLPFRNSLLIRVRKTTALGAGNLNGAALYALYR
jgi:hypothetical protein